MFKFNVVSLHQNFKNKVFKKYNLNGSDSIGVWGDEPFKLSFENQSPYNVEVKFSLDGVDVLSGKKASLDHSDCFLVRPYEKAEISAWVESYSGGSGFLFAANKKNSVALNLHGESANTALGLISCAIYRDFTMERLRNEYYSTVECAASFSPFGRRSVKEENSQYKFISEDTDYLLSAPTVGAGSYVKQNLKKVEGLKSPQLYQTKTISYMWWDDLKNVLSNKENQVFHEGITLGGKVHPAFPAEQNKTNFVDLSSVPKVFDRFI